jgi:hypothetical protein
MRLACASGSKDTAEADTGNAVDTADSAADTASDSASPTADDSGNVDTGDTGAPPDTGDTGGDDTPDTSVPPDTSDSGTVDTADTADTADTGTPPDTGAADLCADLPGSAWNSVDELECGRGAGGMAMCHWRIQFGADGTFDWRYSDVAEVGEWSCVGGVIAASTWSRGPFTATLVDATHLTWVDVAYVRE